MHKTQKSKLQRHNERTGILLTLPAFVFILGIAAFAFIWALVMSFNTNDGVLKGYFSFAGLENYQRALANTEMQTALRNTLVYAALTICIELALALLLSYCLWRGLRGSTFFKLCVAMPMMIAPIAAGMIWRWIFTDRYGILNHLLSLFGIQGPYWLGKPWPAMAAVVLVSVWTAAPFAILVLFSAMANISNDIVEAAKIDGASGWQLYTRIMFPHLKPAISMILVIRIADAIKMFDISRVLTEGGPGVSTRMLSYYVYSRAFEDLQFAQAAAGSFIALIIIAIITLVPVALLRLRRGT